MYSVYVLKSQINDKLYIGFTEDIEKRLNYHNRGKVRSTKAYKPYQLIYHEDCLTRNEARKREIFLKSGKGREFIRTVIN